jgi:hypothetical protein
MYDLNCAIPMRVLLKLSHLVMTLIIDSIRFFSQKPGESLDDCFARFESIVSSLRSCGPLASSDNERAKQLLYALDDNVRGMKITALEESVDFTTLDIEKLFSKFKSHKLYRKCHPNHDASLTSKALITSVRVGGHDANPINTTVSSALEFTLSCLSVTSDEQYESIPDDEIALLARKFCALHKFCKERRRSPRGCFECVDTTHFIADCPKGRSSTPPPRSTTTPSGTMSQACAALSDIDFSSDDSSSSEGDEKPKCKTNDFTDLCLMGKSS